MASRKKSQSERGQASPRKKSRARRDRAAAPGESSESSEQRPGQGEGGGEGAEESSDEALVAEVVDGEPLEEESEPEVVDAELERLAGGSATSDERHGLVKSDPLSAYIQETRRYPLLGREEERDLAIRFKEGGDTGAARQLIESNLRLVVKIAYEYRRAHRNLLDLVQEGNIGLMQAVKKYDPYRGVKLSSYAAWWIRAYILKFILNNWRLVKIGTTQAQRKLFFNLRKEKDRLEQHGFQAEPALLADRLDVRERDIVEMQKRLSAPDASFDAPVGNNDGEGVRTRHDFMAGREEGRPDVRVAEQEFGELLRDKLHAFADTLSGREETIFRERWLTDEPLTLQQIGDRYGISRERARQLEKRMLGRLREHLEAEFGTAVDIDSLSRE